MLPPRFLLGLALLCTAPAASAVSDVLIVDPANGPGAHHTSLQAALAAAASGDVLLLRSGTYAGSFSTGSKTLSLVADEGAQVQLVNSAAESSATSVLRVGCTGGGTAVVRGLRLSTLAGGGVPLVVAGRAGPGGHVFLEECSVPISGSSALRLSGSGATTVSRCTLIGADGSPIGGGSAAVIASGGPVAIFRGTLRGGAGLDAGLYGSVGSRQPMDGQAGAPGFRAEGASVARVLHGTACEGGRGGDGAAPGGNCLPPGKGGDGVQVASGDHVAVTAPLGFGGAGGAAAPGCGSDAAPGELLSSTPPGAAPLQYPGQPATVVTARAVREGEQATITVQGAAGHTVVLLMGFAAQFTEIPALGGVQVVPATLALGLGTLPASGSMVLTVAVPELGPGVPYVMATFQPVSLDAGGTKVLGAPSAMLVLDRRFKPAAFDGGVLPGLCLRVGDAPAGVAAGDLNGDGRADLVVANTGSQTVSVLMHATATSQGTQLQYAAGAGAGFVGLADLDEDGHLDVLVVNSIDDTVSVLLNDGTGGLLPQERYAAGDGPGNAAIADVNGDGHLDVVTSNSGTDSLSALLGDGTGILLPPAASPVADGPGSLTLGDVNGDGHVDAVASHFGLQAVGVYLGNGAGGFAPGTTWPANTAPAGVALGDFDTDGTLDIVVANFGFGLGDGAVSLLLGNGSGGFGAPMANVISHMQPASLVAADLDGDGDLDVATANAQDGSSVSVLLGDGAGDLAAPSNFATPTPGGLAAGDVDADGDLDLITRSSPSDVINVLPNDGAGGFALHLQLETDFSSYAALAGDVNRDGRQDLVTTTGISAVAVLLADGAGGFQPQVVYPVAADPQALALADVDEDGWLDAVVVKKGAKRLGVLLNDGSGVLLPPLEFALPPGTPDSVCVADADGDGHLDLLVAHSPAPTLLVLLGDGHGSFAPAIGYGIGTGASELVVADMNGDGHPDAVLGRGSLATVMLNDGAGAYPTQISSAAASSIQDLATGDLNGDGRLDVVLVHSFSGSVSVLLGDALGGLGTGVMHPVGLFPGSVAIADMDGDGHADVVTANRDANTLSLLAGDGTGALAAHDQYACGNVPNDVALQDVDGDGAPDAITADNHFGSVSVLLNRVP